MCYTRNSERSKPYWSGKIEHLGNLHENLIFKLLKPKIV